MSENKLSIGIVVSKYNSDITENLLEGAKWVFGEGLSSTKEAWLTEAFARPAIVELIGEPVWQTIKANLHAVGNYYKHQVADIKVMRVPGAYELPYGAQCLAEGQNDVKSDGDKLDAIVALGAIIQGETSHHDHIANAVSNGLMQVGLEHKIPVGFGLITANTYKQAEQRAAKGVWQNSAAAKKGEKRGESNKGYEAAKAVLDLLLEQDFNAYISKYGFPI